MLAHRRRGFTLIELLVVIAIIAILAAMLFPVFARARESARKIQCLSNVKNIAMAIQMYLNDYDDRLWPGETRQEVLQYFAEGPGGGDPSQIWCPASDGQRAYWANPYLRTPVLLDEYIKNRDVWNCPSSRMRAGATFIVPYADWFGYLKATEGQWGESQGFGPCDQSWPQGWGGAVTDSIAQQRLAGAIDAWTQNNSEQNAFVQSIGTLPWKDTGAGFSGLRSMSQVGDAASFVVCGDAGPWTDYYDGLGPAAYPDICAAECGNEICASADWANCSDAASCGLVAPKDFLSKPDLMRKYTRHMGGSNLGFLDGHAQWAAAGQIVSMVANRKIQGIYPWGPNTQGYGAIWATGFHQCYPNVPTLF